MTAAGFFYFIMVLIQYWYLLVGPLETVHRPLRPGPVLRALSSPFSITAVHSEKTCLIILVIIIIIVVMTPLLLHKGTFLLFLFTSHQHFPWLFLQESFDAPPSPHTPPSLHSTHGHFLSHLFIFPTSTSTPPLRAPPSAV